MSWLDWLNSLFRPKPAPPPVPTGLGAAILEASNAARSHAGLTPFWMDSRLQAAAAQHASEMATSGVMSHAGFPGRLATAGYPFRAAAENVASGQPSAQAVVDAWLADPPHRANLMGSYHDMGGSGAQARDGTWFWCADYGNTS